MSRKLVTFRIPHLFGSGVGMRYTIKPEYFQHVIGIAEYEWGAISMVQKLLTEKGEVDWTKYHVHCSEQTAGQDGDLVELITFLRDIGGGEGMFLDREWRLPIFSCSLWPIKPQEFVISKRPYNLDVSDIEEKAVI